MVYISWMVLLFQPYKVKLSAFQIPKSNTLHLTILTRPFGFFRTGKDKGSLIMGIQFWFGTFHTQIILSGQMQFKYYALAKSTLLYPPCWRGEKPNNHKTTSPDRMCLSTISSLNNFLLDSKVSSLVFKMGKSHTLKYSWNCQSIIIWT